jgi:predicted exporter/SAM-dependent methyltransferase
MKRFQGPGRFVAAGMLAAAVVLLFLWGLTRVGINPDITAALPQDDPVVASARRILNHHPALENAFIDLSLSGPPRQTKSALAQAADLVQRELAESGLVELVIEEQAAEFMPALMKAVVDHLPLMLRPEDYDRVEAATRPEAVRASLRQAVADLAELGSVGQARTLARDPLGLRDVVLERLGGLMPVSSGGYYRGHLFSADYDRVLIIARPRPEAQAPEFALKLSELLEKIRDRVAAVETPTGRPVQMVWAGGFQAGLDNETIIKGDARRTIILVTVGLVLLILLCFRRPYVGLPALWPAAAGAMLAVFAYSLVRDTIFALSLGFAGTLISIAVDHGLAFTLSLDRPGETDGAEVSRRVWSVSSFTVYTTVLALGALTISGIPLFGQVGLLAALGVGLAAASVHVFFPLLFPRLGPARRRPILPLDRVVNRLTAGRGWAPVVAALVLAAGLGAFINPRFSADLSAMNTVRPETLAAEKVVNQHWGGLTQGAYVLASAPDRERLWAEIERLTDFLAGQRQLGAVDGRLKASFFPGPNEQQQNRAAWNAFWTPNRIERVQADLNGFGDRLGFAPDAFDPFFRLVRDPPTSMTPPAAVWPALGVFPDRQGRGLVVVDSISPGQQYDPAGFFHQADQAGFAVFDGGYFSAHLAEILSRTFVRMLAVIGGAAVVLLFFLFVDFKLLALAFAPLLFSLTVTLGVFGLLDHPLSIPALMLAPIIVGLGMDYGLYLVRSKQRFGSLNHPDAAGFKSAVLLGGLSTMIGGASLLFSDHFVLYSAGLTLFFGILSALAGAFLIVAPLLDKVFQAPARPATPVPAGSPAHFRRTMSRYAHLEPHPRMYARFKIKLDPMFPRLADFVPHAGRLLDIGSGYGIPAAWLAELYPDLRFVCLEPDPSRSRIAARVLSDRAEVLTSGAAEVKAVSGPFDAATILDVIHFLDDDQLQAVLSAIRAKMKPGGRLIVRAAVPGGSRQVWQRTLETRRLKRSGLTARFRTRDQVLDLIRAAGFEPETVEPTAPGREETWFVAEAVD